MNKTWNEEILKKSNIKLGKDETVDMLRGQLLCKLTFAYNILLTMQQILLGLKICPNP